MEWPAMRSATGWAAHHHRHRGAPADNAPWPARLAIWSKAHADEVHELDLGDGPHAGERGAEAWR